MPGRRVLGIAVASGRVGYVLMFSGKPCQWGLSRKAAKDTADATKRVTAWIARFRPDVVVTEKITVGCRKGEKAKSIIEAIAAVAADAEVYDVSVPRPHRHANKFAEAEALVDRFPALRPWLPPPRQLWESEPRNTTIFEALALAVVVIDREGLPAESLGDATQE